MAGPPIALGKQGLKCGEQGLGCMSFGLTMPTGVDLYGKKTVTQEDVIAIVKRAVELGCNHLDTAQIYQSAQGGGCYEGSGPQTRLWKQGLHQEDLLRVLRADGN